MSLFPLKHALVQAVHESKHRRGGAVGNQANGDDVLAELEKTVSMRRAVKVSRVNAKLVRLSLAHEPEASSAAAAAAADMCKSECMRLSSAVRLLKHSLTVDESSDFVECARKMARGEDPDEMGDAYRLQACCAAYNQAEEAFDILRKHGHLFLHLHRFQPLDSAVFTLSCDAEYVFRMAMEFPCMVASVDHLNGDRTPLQTAMFAGNHKAIAALNRAIEELKAK